MLLGSPLGASNQAHTPFFRYNTKVTRRLASFENGGKADDRARIQLDMGVCSWYQGGAEQQQWFQVLFLVGWELRSVVNVSIEKVLSRFIPGQKVVFLPFEPRNIQFHQQLGGYPPDAGLR